MISMKLNLKPKMLQQIALFLFFQGSNVYKIKSSSTHLRDSIIINFKVTLCYTTNLRQDTKESRCTRNDNNHI